MSTPRYTGFAIGLHWIIAIMIFASVGVGLYMVEMAISPTKLRLYSWHKWAGVIIFALVLVRVAWRLTHAAPALPGQLQPWQRTAANAAHYLLLAMMILIPLSGWLMSSAKGFQTVFFGLLPIPDLLEKNEELGETLTLVHKFLTFALIPVVLLHAGAALKHHFIDKDDILKRMLPTWKRRTS